MFDDPFGLRLLFVTLLFLVLGQLVLPVELKLAVWVRALKGLVEIVAAEVVIAVAARRKHLSAHFAIE